MKHFGIISPPVFGHIHPMAALGRELIARGHRVTYLQVIDLEDKVASEGIEFQPIGLDDHPRGSLPRSLAQLGQLAGFGALRFTIDAVARMSAAVCRDAPAAIRAAGIDTLLVDQMEPAGGAVAEHLDAPFITVCNALPINRDAIAPPAFSPWMYRNSPLAKLRNVLGYAVSDWLTSPVTKVVSEYRAKWRLRALASPDDSFSRLAQICQMPRELDFPRANLPDTFHYVGPLRRTAARDIPFPWERLDGRPLVYASLGTLQNSREQVFRCFAEVCRALNVQLVLSHGGGLTDTQSVNLPGSPVIVNYAPQEALLKCARLTLTHAGLNTVLDSLACGVPLVTVPITYEQPAIARRVEWNRCGVSLPLARLQPRRLRPVVEFLLRDNQARDNAATMARAISAAGGVTRATEVVENAVS